MDPNLPERTSGEVHDVELWSNPRMLRRLRRLLGEYGWVAPLDDEPETGWLAG